MTDMRVTLFTSNNPPVLSKTYRLSDGMIVKNPGGLLISGTARIMTAATLQGFADVIQTVGTNQAISLGVPPVAECDIVTDRQHKILGSPAGPFPRTKQVIESPHGSGFLPLDIDQGDSEKLLQIEAVLEIFDKVCPCLMEAGAVVSLSSSSCIYNGDQEIQGVRGIHIFIPIKDATDLQRAGAALDDLFWLHGYGRIKISSCGSMLERNLFDPCVFRAERLIFVSGAHCEPPLEQRRGRPLVVPGSEGVKHIDTRKVLPDLSREELKKVKELKDAAKTAKEPEARAMRAAWLSRRSQADVSAGLKVA